MSSSKKIPMSKSIIKMNTMKVTELRALAKEQGLKGYSRLRKADLVLLLEESSTVATSSTTKKRRKETFCDACKNHPTSSRHGYF